MKSADQVWLAVAGISSGSRIRSGNRRLPRRGRLSFGAVYTRQARVAPTPWPQGAVEQQPEALPRIDLQVRIDGLDQRSIVANAGTVVPRRT
jgi:hypothetical protein